MSKKVWILIAVASFLSILSYSFYQSKQNGKEDSAEMADDINAHLKVEEELPVALEVDDEVIESKLKEDDIEKAERELEAEQTRENTPDSNEEIPNTLHEEKFEVQEEALEEAQEKKREEKAELTDSEINIAKLISEQKLFRRFLNGRFFGTAKVKRKEKNEVWEITMYTRYEKEGSELKGESSIEVLGGSYSGRHRGEGSNRSYLSMGDGSILIELSPQAYLKVNRKNRQRLRGQIFEKAEKESTYKRIGRFELNREE